MASKNSIKIGDYVSFGNNSNKRRTGEIIKMNPKTAIVSVNKGKDAGEYQVTYNLMTKLKPKIKVFEYLGGSDTEKGVRSHRRTLVSKNPTSIKDVGYHKGYTYTKGFASWTPKKFQAQASKDMNILKKELNKLTKTELVSYIKSHGAVPLWRKVRKSDLVTQALNLQMDVLYPPREASRYGQE